MAISRMATDIIFQVGERVITRQPKTKRKANTVVVFAGLILTVIVSGLTWLMEYNVDWLPDFSAQVVAWAGMFLTGIKVNYTKNGVTESTLKDLSDEVNNLVDEQEGDQDRPRVPEPVAPSVSPSTGSTAATGAHSIANELDDIAKRLA